MDDSVSSYLHRELSAAEAAEAEALRMLEQNAIAEFRRLVKQAVLHRFALFDSGFSGDVLALLAQESIRHMVELTGGDLKAAGIISGCGGSTTPAHKKISLLFAMQKAFGVRFAPADAANILTLGDLASEIVQLKTAQTASSIFSPPTDTDLQRVMDIRRGFPWFSSSGNAAYLDNCATTQVSSQVIDAVTEYYRTSNANVHRGINSLGQKSTRHYEYARERVADFIGADCSEIVFTGGATAGLNMIAKSLGRTLKAGQRIVVMQSEHHSNYLPWLELCRDTGAGFEPLPVDHNGNYDEKRLLELLKPPTVLFAFSHCSNVLGKLYPAKELCRAAAASGVLTVVDGAQGIRHEAVDVHDMGCSFYVFSSHKLMAGMGCGVLYCRQALMDVLPPPFTGGGMTEKMISASHAKLAPCPQCWEAGTPNVAGAVALVAAIDHRRQLGEGWIVEREAALMRFLETGLKKIEGVKLLGNPEMRFGCISFTVDGVSPQDVEAALSEQGIFVRSGHHCASLLHSAMGVDASVRVSPAYYNTFDELARFLDAVLLISKTGRYALPK